ncbi:AhpC/TSA family protein [Mycetocola lacteus]|uniref:thioredoxin-dependent peroxiredoxin n=1 Tax=Mycetocola lacteus TaxID=76637 RepID=A0A3L7AFN8_9MICO|nr:peroxiredoxin-like family protein [Mycetocola lacteus]RLP79266.1 AhpC/TSA family protein [Mycetocola lacteus]
MSENASPSPEISPAADPVHEAPGLPLGSAFPDAQLIGPHGEPTTFAAVRGDRPAVVVFYRGAWCPYCNVILARYRNELAGPLREAGIALIALSPQTPDGSLSITEKNDLDFDVLSDPGNTLATELGILLRLDEQAQELYRGHGVDFTEVNADGTAVLPLPTVAILSATGTLEWIETFADFTQRTEPATILAALESVTLR